MKHYWVAPLCAITFVGLAILMFASTGQAAPGSTSQTVGTENWRVECVDCPRQFSFHAMRLDSDALPHIVYGLYSLYYASYDGAAWQIETVDDNGGMYPSLALDGLNRPHIGYLDAVSSILKYAWYDGTQWQHEVVDSAWGGSTSVVLDSASYPHLIYFSGNNLRYAWRDGAQWHSQVVAARDSAAAASENSASLALDEMDRPHIAYFDNISNNLKYASYDGLAWNVEMVDGIGSVGNISLALDQMGHPHISYYDPSLKYAWFDGTAWHVETVDAAGTAGRYSSLGLDAADQPHISYEDGSNHQLKHTWHTPAGWQFEMVDDADPTATTIALNNMGKPHISYQNGSNLNYARYDGAIWHIETIDTSRTSGGGISLALDKSSHPHVSYFDGPSPSLKYREHNGANWVVVTVATPQSGGYTSQKMDTSLKLDQGGQPHISYATYDAKLQHAWRGGDGWHIETIDNDSVQGSSALALNQLGQPRISYQGDSSLKYAWQDGTTWHIETVDNSGITGGNSSMVLDTADHPHISYCSYVPVCNPRFCNYFCEILNYAWSDGTRWYTQTVLSRTGATSSYTSLALDSKNRPHIGYYGQGINYAWYDGSTWNFETVDSKPFCDMWGNDTCLSLALDKADKPHLAYTRSGLNYAWRNDAGWHTEMVDSGTGFVSLALDQLSLPHIGYNAGFNLKYARQLPTLVLEKQAIPDRELHSGDTLTYTLTLTGPSLNVTLADPLPAIASYVPGSLTETITPSAIYSPAIHTILWQGTLPTDTAQTIRFQVISDMANTGTLVLSPPIVNTAWLTDTDNNRSLSATVIVNGTYFYLPIIMRNS